MRISNGILIGKKLNGIEVTAKAPQDLIDSLQALLEEVESTEEVMRNIALENADNEEALVLKDFYPFWDENYKNKEGENLYPTGFRFRHPTGEGIKLFKVIKEHEPKIEFQPHEANYLYLDLEGQVDIDDEGNPTEDYPVWKQPDYRNPYPMGSRAYYPDEEGLLYEVVQVNTVANEEQGIPAGNSYSPIEWGWVVVNE